MNYHTITRADVLNGTGFRVVLWISGCTLKCKGCHNPETWDFCSGNYFSEQVKKELFEALSKEYISGITLSGGHPLEDQNCIEVYNLLKEIKENFPEKNIWLYTGYDFKDLFPELKDKDIVLNLNEIEKIKRSCCSLCDVIVDCPYIETERDITLKWRGSKNQRVIDVKKTLKEGEIVLYCD